MVCDGSDAVNGKMYILGGGWDRLIVQQFGQEQVINLAVKLMIPWYDTNRRIPFRIMVRDENDVPLIPDDMGGELEVGRPPGYSAEESIPFFMPLGVKVAIDRPKRLVFTLSVGGAEVGRTAIRVIAPPGPSPR